MAEVIYVVKCETGTYDDYSCVNEKAFFSKTLADFYVIDKTEYVAESNRINDLMHEMMDAYEQVNPRPAAVKQQIVPSMPSGVPQNSPAFIILLNERTEIRENNKQILQEYYDKHHAWYKIMLEQIKEMLIRSGVDENDPRLGSLITSSFSNDARYSVDEVEVGTSHPL